MDKKKLAIGGVVGVALLSAVAMGFSGYRGKEENNRFQWLKSLSNKYRINVSCSFINTIFYFY